VTLQARDILQMAAVALASLLACAILSSMGCGGASTQASSHSAITAACIERERHIVARDAGAEEDQRDIARLRVACDALLMTVESIP
jgi:hypothetical protein